MTPVLIGKGHILDIVDPSKQGSLRFQAHTDTLSSRTGRFSRTLLRDLSRTLALSSASWKHPGDGGIGYGPWVYILGLSYYLASVDDG